MLIFDLDDTIFPRLPDGFSEEQLRNIKPLPFVLEILKNSSTNVLVTKGDPKTQTKKIKILNLEHYFLEIVVCSADHEKKECFQRIMKKYPQQDLVIIGDRLDSEIRYGNELGLKTIRIKRGKYKDLQPKDKYEIPHHEINTFAELEKIL